VAVARIKPGLPPTWGAWVKPIASPQWLHLAHPIDPPTVLPDHGRSTSIGLIASACTIQQGFTNSTKSKEPGDLAASFVAGLHQFFRVLFSGVSRSSCVRSTQALTATDTAIIGPRRSGKTSLLYPNLQAINHWKATSGMVQRNDWLPDPCLRYRLVRGRLSRTHDLDMGALVTVYTS